MNMGVIEEFIATLKKGEFDFSKEFHSLSGERSKLAVFKNLAILILL